MKTKLITVILTLLACVSFSFNCQADNPPKQDQGKAINPQNVSRPIVEVSQQATWVDLFVVYILDGQGRVVDAYVTFFDNIPKRADVPGGDVVVYPYFVYNQLDSF